MKKTTPYTLLEHAYFKYCITRDYRNKTIKKSPKIQKTLTAKQLIEWVDMNPNHEKIRNILSRASIRNLEGIGISTLERIYRVVDIERPAIEEITKTDLIYLIVKTFKDLNIRAESNLLKSYSSKTIRGIELSHYIGNMEIHQMLFNKLYYSLDDLEYSELKTIYQKLRERG